MRAEESRLGHVRRPEASVSAPPTQERPHIVAHLPRSFQVDASAPELILPRRPEGPKCAASQVVVTSVFGLSPRGLGLRRHFPYHGLEVPQRFVNGQGVHLTINAFAGFQGRLEVVTGDLDGERVGDELAGTILVLNPGRMRQGDPHRAASRQKLDIDRIGMSCSDGDNEGLINAVHFLPGPAIECMEISIHDKTTIAEPVCSGQTPSGLSVMELSSREDRLLLVRDSGIATVNYD